MADPDGRTCLHCNEFRAAPTTWTSRESKRERRSDAMKERRPRSFHRIRYGLLAGQAHPGAVRGAGDAAARAFSSGTAPSRRPGITPRYRPPAPTGSSGAAEAEVAEALCYDAVWKGLYLVATEKRPNRVNPTEGQRLGRPSSTPSPPTTASESPRPTSPR